MQRVKVFHVKAEPTSKTRRDLGDNITEQVNAWLEFNDHVEILNISHSAETKSAYPEALVIVTYSGEEKKAVPVVPPAVPSPAAPAPSEEKPSKKSRR